MQDSFNKQIYLTFDFDWANDEVLRYTLDIIRARNVRATFFITHNTNLINDILSDGHEVGIHPNFNNYFELREIRSIAKVITELKDIVPDAVSVRAHSLVTSTKIVSKYVEKGFTHVTDIYIPFESNMVLMPYRQGGAIRLPIIWEDDLFCGNLKEKKLYYSNINTADYINYPGLKVFNFHPIHIFLNTEEMERYEKSRPYFDSPNDLQNHRNYSSKGTNDFLIDLIDTSKILGYDFRCIKEICI